MDQVKFTGERFVPGTRGEIWIEHWHRYHFARRWAAGRSVLDVACGEGYGSALLARDAAQVVGVDVAEEAIAHARRAYASIGNLRFERAPCTALPLPDASIDVAISFETIEHIAEQAPFVDELARVLRPEGLLILSCPNRLEYRDRRGFENPYHVKELYREELAQLVASRFGNVAWYGQRPSFFSVIAPEATDAEARGQLVEVEEADPSRDSPRLEHPLYFLVVASRDATAIRALPPSLSVLSDRGDWVHRDYEKVMRDLNVTVDRGEALEKQLQGREVSIRELQEQVKSLQLDRDALRETLEGSISRLEGDVRARDQAIAEREREILRRRGWRWWLRLPFVRLGMIRE